MATTTNLQHTLRLYSHHQISHKDRLIEYAQPLPTVVVHLNSIAAELGLTSEELAQVLQDQEEWMKEEEQRYEEEEYTGEAQHQEWNHHNNNASAWSMPPLHEHHMHNATDDDNSHRQDRQPTQKTFHCSVSTFCGPWGSCHQGFNLLICSGQIFHQDLPTEAENCAIQHG